MGARWLGVLHQIDYDLFTHDAQASALGSSCDPKTSATASRETLLPGGTVRLIGIGPLQAAGIAMLDALPLNPGLDLAFLGAPGCMVYVMPTLAFGCAYLPPALDGYGGAMVALQLPRQSYLLGARLHAQWLAFPNPRNPGQLTTTNALALQVATQLPSVAGVTVRTGVVADAAHASNRRRVAAHVAGDVSANSVASRRVASTASDRGRARSRS